MKKKIALIICLIIIILSANVMAAEINERTQTEIFDTLSYSQTDYQDVVIDSTSGNMVIRVSSWE
ncbi:MAG: hypothetical protein U9Q80_00510 [Bacillota bacterium]|nr:hypothetical protein [Bacillota bacterium]